MSATDKRVVQSHLPEDRPCFYAFVSAFVYVLIALFYIIVSGQVAAALAGSLEQLRVIEAVKGIAFVLVTGFLFFLISLGFWRKTRRQRDMLMQSERKAVASMYSASLAHDLNNLLMGLSGLVETIKDREKSDAVVSELGESVARAIQRLTPFARRIAATAKHLPSGVKAEADLSAAVPQTVDMLRKHPDVRLCSLEVDAIPQVALSLDLDLFDRALSNLVVNAAQAAGVGGKVKVRVTRSDTSAAIEVHDSGPGISADKAASVFEPGFTTKRSGIGLGLLTVQAFAASCQADIQIDRSPLGGALIRLSVPLNPAPQNTAY